MKQVFELYRMVGKAFCPVETLDYMGKIVTKELSPTNALKIMFSNRPPFDKVNYYFLIDSNVKIVHTSDIELRDDCATNGKYVYELNADTCNFMPAKKYAEYVKDGLEDILKEDRGIRDVMTKLSGGGDIELDDVMFKNIKKCRVFATIGEDKHELYGTAEFLKPIYDIYIPRVRNGEIAYEPFDYSNLIYKHHSNSAVSWMAIPKGCYYIVDCVNNFDKDFTGVKVFNYKGEVEATFNNMEDLKASKSVMSWVYRGKDEDFIRLLDAKITIEVDNGVE